MVTLSGLKELSLNIKNRRTTCVIFGGSFNPPHVGHQIVFSYALDLFDGDFFILPTKKPPHKEVKIDFYKRFYWAEESFKDFKSENVFLWDLENHIEGVNYAIKNVQFFLPYYDKIIILAGEDALGNIEKWYQYEKLFEYAYFAIYPRTKDGYLYERGRKVLKDLYSRIIELRDFPIVEISSTEIRNRVIEKKNIIGMVDNRIIDDVIDTFLHSDIQR